MKKIPQSRLTVALVLIAVSAVGGIVLAQLTYTATVNSTGNIYVESGGGGGGDFVKVGVYNDSSCAQVCGSVGWGTLKPGDQVNRTIYIRNEGNVGITLTLDTQNWNPSEAGNYMSLTWDYDRQTVAPNVVIPVVLTLKAESNATGTSFSFDIVITATG